MKELFTILSDKLEKLLASWWGAFLYIALMIPFFFYSWDALDRYIYVTNAIIVVLLVNTTRRDSLATHRKLDDIVPEDDKEIEKKTDEELE